MKLPFLEPLSKLSKRIGIDLGTSRIRIWSDQDGFVIDEPSCVAIDTSINKVLAVGDEARTMLGRMGEHVQVVFPLVGGVVRDKSVTEAMLRVFLQRVMRSTLFFRPIVMASVPSAMAEPEKIALTDILFAVGFREVNFIDQILAAAIGAGVPIADASGSFLFHSGAGVVETGIISMSSLVAVESSPEAGIRLDREIRRQIRQQYQLEVGRATAERAKQQVLSLLPTQARELRLTGQDIVSSAPKEVTVTNDALYPVIKPFIDEYVHLIRHLFTRIPPELATDIIDKGVLLTGGGASLHGLDSFLIQQLDVPVTVVDEPEQTVIRGISQVLANIELFRESTGYRYEAVRNG